MVDPPLESFDLPSLQDMPVLPKDVPPGCGVDYARRSSSQRADEQSHENLHTGLSLYGVGRFAHEEGRLSSVWA
jgi:hypothetical protein